MDMSIRSMLPEEQKYTYTQSTQIAAQTGCIGHLRADLGSGEAFFSSWEDHGGDEKTQAFRDELDSVINALRKGILKSRSELSKYCYSHPEAGFGNDREWGLRVNTERYSYLMRLNPNKGEYNLYCYCYRRDWLDQHIEQARQGIRFITPHYEEKFRIPDGDQIRISYPDGDTRDRTARYIDEYHVEIGSGFSSNLYHICEMAEILERSGGTVIPLRSSLPERCFVYVESTDEIGIVTRGEMGYTPTQMKPEGVSKRQGVAYLNEAQGITPAQVAAMNAGSLFGWDTKAADPANYNEAGVLQKQQRSRGAER